MSQKPATRLYVAADLAAGARIALGAAEAHRLRDVLRLKPGDVIALFNGRDGEFAGRLAELDRDGGSALAEECLRPQRGSADLWLVFALVKRPRLEWLVEKATEIGASALVPVTTQRTVTERINVGRLEAIAREAAEQSERLDLPEIRAVIPLPALIAAWPAERRLILCDETGTAPPIAARAAELPPGPLACLIGPEGGFAESELDALRKLPFVFPAGLGPRVLRSETAALGALSVLQAFAGDWSAARSRVGPADASL
ncbi:MAG TPA: 16S rRNA (uracil(1498)-N(3))-methyltransferase [Stellaceae bacterium]|nr:16S rRNA (uracil(1498)-N(3))-methyltransferase [Stellaceae bacterium]